MACYTKVSFKPAFRILIHEMKLKIVPILVFLQRLSNQNCYFLRLHFLCYINAIISPKWIKRMWKMPSTTYLTLLTARDLFTYVGSSQCPVVGCITVMPTPALRIWCWERKLRIQEGKTKQRSWRCWETTGSPRQIKVANATSREEKQKASMMRVSQNIQTFRSRTF